VSVDPLLEGFCRKMHPRLVAAVSLHCGDGGLAEEIAQESLIRACARWSKVRTMNSPEGWVFRVAFNLANSHFRRARIERRARERLTAASRRPVEQVDERVSTGVAVRRAVGSLPPRQRAAVVLRHLLDVPVADVAEVMGTSEGAVKALTHRGVSALREWFDLEAAEVVDHE
jgi:RNA polymerase sigma-70 factor, ECF subfamily